MKYNVDNPLIVHNAPTLESLEFAEFKKQNFLLKEKLKKKALKRKLLELQTSTLIREINLTNSLKS